MLGLSCCNCSRSYNPILDEEPIVPKEIRIQTGTVVYKASNPIDIKITNLLTDDAVYPTCGDLDLPPTLVLKFEGGKWIEEEVSGLCAQDESLCYCKTLEWSAEADRKIAMPFPGLYKLRYSFEVKSELVHFFSNEFEVIN